MISKAPSACSSGFRILECSALIVIKREMYFSPHLNEMFISKGNLKRFKWKNPLLIPVKCESSMSTVPEKERELKSTFPDDRKEERERKNPCHPAHARHRL